MGFIDSIRKSFFFAATCLNLFFAGDSVGDGVIIFIIDKQGAAVAFVESFGQALLVLEYSPGQVRCDACVEGGVPAICENVDGGLTHVGSEGILGLNLDCFAVARNDSPKVTLKPRGWRYSSWTVSASLALVE